MYECVDKNPDSVPGTNSDNYVSCLVLYTMLKLTAMEWLVHLTTHRKNSPVQFVPNKVETTTLECNFCLLVQLY